MLRGAMLSTSGIDTGKLLVGFRRTQVDRESTDEGAEGSEEGSCHSYT